MWLFNLSWQSWKYIGPEIMQYELRLSGRPCIHNYKKKKKKGKKEEEKRCMMYMGIYQLYVERV